jgi:hypothetical protein
MTIKSYLKTVWEDAKAYRRGEVRVAPRGVTGRVYARKDGQDSSPGSIELQASSVGTISAKVYRARTGTWEDLGVICKADITRG